jgi:hypothetical protein
MHNRKRLEIAFRRWVDGSAPSARFVSLLRCQDRATYCARLGELGDIDHIVPLSFFDLANPLQIALAWSLDNVRRIPKQENRERGASIESAYLTLLGQTPQDRTEQRALLDMVESKFIALHPRITLHVEQCERRMRAGVKDT